MNSSIRVLHLEDNPRDAELIRDRLEAEGLDCEITLVSGQQAFESALDQGAFDLILCDNKLPDYDGFTALAQARIQQPATPVIMISGTLGEEAAVDCLKSGDTDYVLKQRLGRLAPAARRALANAAKAVELSRAEEAMRESESKYRHLVESLSDAAFLADERTGRILDTNAQAERLLGRKRGEIVGSPIEGCHSQETVAAFRQWLLAGREQQCALSQDGEIVRADGRAVPVHVTASPLTFHHQRLTLVLYRDLTELKQFETRLLRLQAPAPGECANRSLRILHLEDNPLDAELIRDRLEAAGLVCEITRVGCREPFEAALDQSAFDVILCDYNLPDYDGYTALAQARAKQPGVPAIIISGSLDEEGAVKCLHSGATDYLLKQRLERLPSAIKRALEGAEEHRKRQQAEKALRDSETLFHSLVENLPQHVFRKDLAGRFTFGNGPFCQSLGKPLAEILGQTDLDFCPPALAEKYRQDDRRVIETGQSFETEEEHRQASGKMSFVRVAKTPLRDASGQIVGVQGISWDITERKQIESQMLRTQRLESIGTLAGGIAHDLNNALAPILMATELLRLEFPDTAARYLELIQSGARRGADMVKQLLTFAKGAEGERLLIQPHHLLKEMQKLIKSTFPKNIELRTHYAKDLWTVRGDATQLHQVLLNLCVNARDAMPEGGTLTLEAENLALDAAQANTVPEAPPGPYVVWRVTDTGLGIPPEILDRIFEPFFTTKGPDKGTGLGLSTTLGIIKGHGGFIRAHSVPGQGTTFAVYLPACGSDASDTSRLTKTEMTFRGHGETILVVDDEVGVRNVLRAVLTQLNFKVLTAADGTTALIQVAENQADLRAVITDLHMPHMDGLAFVRVLKGRLPQVGIIVVSGRLDEREADEFKQLGVHALLDKPFTQEKLVAALKTIFPK